MTTATDASTAPLPEPEAVAHLTGLLRQAQRIAFVTGAGMSTESGIPDFRSSSGLYATGTAESTFDLEAFKRDPGPFYRFALGFFDRIMAATPNAGHRAIAELQDRLGKTVDVATQNIDLLHQQAGTRCVHPVHGTIATATCTECGAQVPGDSIWATVRAGRIPWHGCGGVLKPDVVFFGEVLPEEVLWRARRAVTAADLVVVLGTSLTVHPAAMLPGFRRHGVPVVVVNRTPTVLDAEAALVFRAAIGSVLPPAVAAIRDAD